MSGVWNHPPPGWARVRSEVLMRDRYTCKVRGPGCTTHATHVHHRYGNQTDPLDTRYLVASCATCNLKIGNPAKAAGVPLWVLGLLEADGEVEG